MPSLYCTRAKYYPGLDVTLHRVTHPVDVVTAVLRRFFLGEHSGDYWFDSNQVGLNNSDFNVHLLHLCI